MGAVARPAESQAASVRAPRLPPEHVLRVARRVFMESGTLEMQSLARVLGIGRATLYRWRGDREAVLSEVIVSLGVANLLRCEAETTLPAGPERFCTVHDLHLRRISDSEAMRAFIRAEPEVASRVLLDGQGAVHVGVTRALADLIRRQEQESRWRAPMGADGLAAAVSRLSEAFLYSDLIAHDKPDVKTPDLVLRMMLGVPLRSPDGRRRTKTS